MDATLRNPGDVIAALPAILGYTPQRSLCVLPIADGAIACAMRVDLAEVEKLPLDTLAEHAARANASGVLAVVVDGDGAHCAMCADDHTKIIEQLGIALVAWQIPMFGSYVVDDIATGGRWHSVDRSTSGAVPDPRASAIAAGAVVSGRRTYATRDELVRTLAPSRARPSLARAIDAVAPIPTSEGIAEVISMAAGADTLATSTLARFAVIVADVHARDALLKLVNDGRAAAAMESLFTQASRALTGVHRANALTVVAFFAYARGDGSLAGIALDTALRLAPSHSLATLLDTALRAALPPSQIRALVDA